MALDQVPTSSKEIRAAIARNIGNTFVKLGKYQEAISHYKLVVKDSTDMRTAFNLLLCYYAQGERENVQDGFRSLMRVRFLGSAVNAEEDGGGDDMEEDNEAVFNDNLKEFLRERKHNTQKMVVSASKLIAPMIDRNGVAGYDFVIKNLRSSPQHSMMKNDVQIAKAMSYIKKKVWSHGRTPVCLHLRTYDRIGFLDGCLHAQVVPEG